MVQKNMSLVVFTFKGYEYMKYSVHNNNKIAGSKVT